MSPPEWSALKKMSTTSSGVYADAAKSMVKEFEDKTGATVDVIDMPYTELHQKMLRML